MIDKMKRYSMFLAFIAFGAFAFLSGASDMLMSAKLTAYGETARGLVVDVVRVRQGRHDIVVEFQDPTGAQHSVRSGRSYGVFSLPSRGDPVAVKYLPEDPQVSMISSLWQLYFGPLLVFSIGIVGLYAGARGAFGQHRMTPEQ